MYLRSRLIVLLVLLVVLVGLAVVWGMISLEDLWSGGHLEGLFGRFTDSPWLPWMVSGGVILGLQVAVPQVVLVVASVMLLGPWEGFFVAYLGMLVGSAIGYFIGRVLARHPVRRLSSRRMKQLSRLLAKRGMLNMAVINLLPIGPHTLINLAAGSTHLRFRDFLPGTAIGILPSTVVVAVATHMLLQLGRTPTSGETSVAVLLVGLLILGLWLLTRWAWHWLARS